MSDQEIVVGTKEVPSFIKKKHELDKIFKILEKASPDAIKLLTDTMNNLEVPLKTRIECANQIVEFAKTFAQQINADEMARLIAEVKLGEGGSKKLVLEEGKKKTPSLNFEDIREV